MPKRDALSMNQIGRREYLTALGTAGICSLAGCAGELGGGGGGEFPNQEIEMICPWAAGGGTDLTGRRLAELAQEHLGVSAYVTNQTGGSGSVGFNAIANSEANGYTVGITTVEICTISHIGISDITPEALGAVMQYNFDPAALTVPQDAPYNTVEEFVAYAENNPGGIRVSNSGTGAIWHLSAAGFAQQAGIELNHVSYDGGSPATQAVVSGEVEATTASAAEVASQVQDGPLRILAVFGEERVDLFPEVPTLRELGYDFTMGAWRGLTVPQGTPQERIGTLEEGFTNVYESDVFQSFMQEQGFGLVYRNAEEFGQFMQSEYDRFGRIIDEIGLQQSG